MSKTNYSQLLAIALRHLLARRRQSLVSLFGIVLGVGFFLAVSSLMQGSENDFIRRLVDNSPHFTIFDQYRQAPKQAIETLSPSAIIELRHLKPLSEPRGIRGYTAMVEQLRLTGDIAITATLVGQALVSFAGKDVGITLNGVLPEEFKSVSSLDNYFIAGNLAALNLNPDGMIIGENMAKNMGISLGGTLSLISAASSSVGFTSNPGDLSSNLARSKVFKVVGIFRTGRAAFDENQAFVQIKRLQALLGRPQRVNQILAKLEDPHLARSRAWQIEQQFGYKTVSWQESSEDVLKILTVRNIILYTVVSAVLVVAAFGIYNIISTIVIEKSRDIAILKSIGFRARDIEIIFLLQGFALGLLGILLGLPFGAFLVAMLEQIPFKIPGSSEQIYIPMDWGIKQFFIASAFAMSAATIAALLPAKKAARVNPVDILRGIS